jgi:hypothetical protein
VIASVHKVKDRAVAGAKQQYGTDVYGALRYLFGPGKANEHTDPHLVGVFEGAHLDALAPRAHVAGDGSTRYDVRDLARLLESPVMNPNDPHVYHVSVSTKGTADRTLTDEEWHEVAAELMHATGIAPRGDDLGCLWVAVRHGLSKEGNDHIHILATLTRLDGQRVSPWQDFQKMRGVCNAFERRFGLTVTNGGDGTQRKQPSRKAQEAFSRAGFPHVREDLWKAVSQAAAQASSEMRFLAALRQAGLVVETRTNAAGLIEGYSVGMPGHVDRHGDQITFKGSDLAGDLSWNALRVRWAGTIGTPTIADAEQVLDQARETLTQAAEAMRSNSADADAVAWAAGEFTQTFPGISDSTRAGVTDAARPPRHHRASSPLADQVRISGRQVAMLTAIGPRHPATAILKEVALLLDALNRLRDAQARTREATGALLGRSEVTRLHAQTTRAGAADRPQPNPAPARPAAPGAGEPISPTPPQPGDHRGRPR